MFPIPGASAPEIPYRFLSCPWALDPNPFNEDELLYFHLLDASRTIPPVPAHLPLHPSLPSALIPRSLLAAHDLLLDEYVCTHDCAEEDCQTDENNDIEAGGVCEKGVWSRSEGREGADEEGLFEGQRMVGGGGKGSRAGTVEWEALDVSEGEEEVGFVEEEEVKVMKEGREVPVIRVEMVGEGDAPLTGLRKPPTRKRKSTAPVEETPVKRRRRAGG